MSEEAKEKPGAGKAAHRKKKGKKVGERGASLSGGVCSSRRNQPWFLLEELLLLCHQLCFMVGRISASLLSTTGTFFCFAVSGHVITGRNVCLSPEPLERSEAPGSAGRCHRSVCLFGSS